MGTSDIPPPGAPTWLVQAQTGILGVGVLLWGWCYVLMTRRSIQTKSYSLPLLALAIDLGWELVFVFYVTDTAIEVLGFLSWLVLDLGLVYTTIKFGPHEWRLTSPWVGRSIGWILAGMTAVACLGHYAFSSWWLAEPGRGFGNKDGKWWNGHHGIDTTELAFWSAAVAQLFVSAGSLAMLVVRGHSGGTSYGIWFTRTLGTLFGLIFADVLLWWYWPSAHGFILHPVSIFLCGTSVACDLVYPFVLHSVRQTEVRLPDGRLVAGSQALGSREKSA